MNYRLFPSSIGAGLLGSSLAMLLFAPALSHADEKGDAILKAAFEKLHAAKTLSMDVSISNSFALTKIQKGTVVAKKPNFLRAELMKQGGVLMVSDGKNSYQLPNGSKQYFKSPVDAKPQEMQGFWEGEVDSFFGGVAGLKGVETTYSGHEKVGGVECDVVIAKKESRTFRYSVGTSDHLIYRNEFTIGKDQTGKEVKQTSLITNIKLNAAIGAKVFAFAPPPGAKLYEQPDYNAKLVAVGKAAPAFSLPSPHGETVSLASAKKDKKAVLVNFWFYG